MGFVTAQQEEFRSKIDADSAAYDPNYVIAVDTAGSGEAPAAPAAASAPADGSGAPAGYEASPPPQ
jgi:hypothetical protein